LDWDLVRCWGRHVVARGVGETGCKTKQSCSDNPLYFSSVMYYSVMFVSIPHDIIETFFK
jgi:hypothetical protein